MPVPRPGLNDLNQAEGLNLSEHMISPYGLHVGWDVIDFHIIRIYVIDWCMFSRFVKTGPVIECFR